MRRGEKLQAITSGLEDLVIRQRARGPIGEVVDHDDGADETADRLRPGRDTQPFIQRAALVGFEVAEANPTELAVIEDGRHAFEGRWKHFLHARMHDKRLFVGDEKLIELNAELRMKGGNTKNVGGDFCNIGLHDFSPYPARAKS